MALSRRGFLKGLGITAAVAPAIIRTPGLLMPIRPYRLDVYTGWDQHSYIWMSESSFIDYARPTFAVVSPEQWEYLNAKPTLV
jgi:hypothetical protein